MTHYKLSMLTDAELLGKEIVESGNILSQKLNKDVDHFAYPFGDIDSINDYVLKIIKEKS